VDGNGNALDGAYTYVMHFDKADPAASQNVVWSISAYRENFYVHNALERYGLLPSMPKYNPDGSLDVYSRRSHRVRTRSQTGCRFRQTACST
jgi:hypothetical protein